MKSISNIAEVEEAGEGTRLPAGGYICRYTHVEDKADKEYLWMEFDIAEGEYKDYFTQLNERAGFWAGKCIRSYKQTALPMFKRMCSAVSKSNPNFIFDGNQYADEGTLIGKKVGMILGEEEYLGNDGNVKTRLYVVRECNIEKIIEGDYKVPELKKLEGTATNKDTSFVDVAEGTCEEVPFN